MERGLALASFVSMAGLIRKFEDNEVRARLARCDCAKRYLSISVQALKFADKDLGSEK
jgi:hypothetical protein